MSDLRRFLVMQSGVHQYALPFGQVSEISELRDLSPVPRAPVWCLGATRSAGVVVAVVDLARYLGNEQETHPEKLVVLDFAAGGLALQVGTVSAVLLEEPCRLEKTGSESWLVSPEARIRLLDSLELVQEISAAMGR